MSHQKALLLSFAVGILWKYCKHCKKLNRNDREKISVIYNISEDAKIKQLCFSNVLQQRKKK